MKPVDDSLVRGLGLEPSTASMLFRMVSTSLLLACCISLHAQDLRTLLLGELRSTHDKEEWFVPVSVAVADLTPEQASWTDGKGNHSVGQLANHLLFWNRRQLQKLTGEKSTAFDGNNDETFNTFDAKNWAVTVRELDTVLIGLEKIVQAAEEPRACRQLSQIVAAAR